MPLGSPRVRPLTGPPMTAVERADGLAFARNWRIANKPKFDAIYGPELRWGHCPTCGARAPVAIEGAPA